MNHKYASDCHNHSHCSPDGDHSVSAMLARARELGLYAWTLTDHCECQKFESRYRDRVRRAWEEMAGVEAAGLRFCRGIELGQPLEDLAAAQEALGGRDYDFVIGSLHNLRDKPDFYYMDAANMDPEELHGLLDAYWDEILAMIAWGGFDSLGHLTYPLRYIQGEHGVPVDMSRHAGKLDQVFQALVQAGKALEVNTSGLRQKLGEAMPNLSLLKRYHELGGRLVTLGSDAHCAEDLGRGIDEGMELLKAAGFTEFAIYEKRRPVMLPLE